MKSLQKMNVDILYVCLTPMYDDFRKKRKAVSFHFMSNTLVNTADSEKYAH